MGSKLNKNLSVSTKIILQIIVLIVFSCMTLGIISSTYATKIINSSINNDLIKRADDSSKIINKEIKNYVDRVEDIAQRPDIRSMDWSLQQDILINEAKRIGFERFQVGDLNGDVLSTTGDKANASDRDFYKEALKGTSNISDVLFARIDKKMTIVISSPIYDLNGNVVGVLSGVQDASKLNEIIANIDLTYDGYVFMLNKTGIKMSHKDYALVEKADNDLENVKENASLKDFADIQQKMTLGENGCSTYDQDGKHYIIAYSKVLDGKWSLGIVQDKNQVFESSVKLQKIIIIVAGLFVLLGAIVGVIISSKIKKPLKEIQGYTKALANQDLTISLKSNSTDEFGQVIESINTASSTLRHIIAEVKNESNSVAESVESAENMLNNVNEHIQDVSASSEEISASMEECTSSIQDIESKVLTVTNQTKSLTEKSQYTLLSVKKMKEKANNIKHESVLQKENSKKLCASSKENLEQAIEESRSVEQIAVMIEKILDIANQTNLLALNASIEAARAGEQGKGFAVVAEEVGFLAEESSATVEDMRNVVNKVLQSVNSLSTSSDDAFNLLENEMNNILNRNIEISDDYNSTQETFESAFNEYVDTLNDVGEAVNVVCDEIGNISLSSEQVAKTSTDIATHISKISDKSLDILKASSNNKESIERLSKTVSKFKL